MIDILVFTAPWCNPCQAYKEALKNGTDLNINIVDIEQEPDTGISYHVRSVPLTLLLKDNVEVARYVGPTTVDFLRERVKEHA